MWSDWCEYGNADGWAGGAQQDIICTAVQVDQKNESILVPIYGLMVPFHILAVKNAVNSQEGDHSYIRINFNFGPAYEPGAKFAQAIFLKELSYRTSDNRHAAKVRPSPLRPLAPEAMAEAQIALLSLPVHVSCI